MTNFASVILILQLTLSVLNLISSNPSTTLEDRQKALALSNTAVILANQTLQSLTEKFTLPSSSSNISVLPTPTPTSTPQPTTPYFVADFIIVTPLQQTYLTSYDRISYYFTVIIKTRLSNGNVLPDKQVTINGINYISDDNGLINYIATINSLCNDIPFSITVVGDGRGYDQRITPPIPTNLKISCFGAHA